MLVICFALTVIFDIILDMRDVPSLDTTAMVALESLRREPGKLAVASNLAHAERMSRRWLGSTR